MRTPRPAEDVKLVMSLFACDPTGIAGALLVLAGHYGRPDFIGPLVPFDETRYYEDEMGPSLVRRFVSYERLVRPESLPAIKGVTNGVETQFARNGKRGVNIDPGYVAQAHLILATTKGYAHRPYLREGIYADLTLIYQNGTFQSLPWTYPDYAQERTRKMLKKMREKYIWQLKGEFKT